MKKLFLVLVIFMALGVLLPLSGKGETTISLTYPPPCLLSGGNQLGPCPQDIGSSIGAYIRTLYQFAVGVSGVLAVGMIVAGAIFISVSAGSPDRQKEGRDMILSAIWGILLLLGSYIILNTINPQLVNLNPPSAARVPASQIAAYNLESGVCPNNSQTGCFFSDSGEACDFQDPSAVCNAVDRSTRICRPNGYTENDHTFTAPYPCSCQNCQLISGSIPIRSFGCSGSGVTSSTLGQCFLEKNTLKALKDFFNQFSRAGSGLSPSMLCPTDLPRTNPGSDNCPWGTWRVTEAFPPTTYHSSPAHYNGRAVDFSRATNFQSNSPVNDASFCNDLKAVAVDATGDFSAVLIEGLPPNYCTDIPIGTELNLPGQGQGSLRRMTTTGTTTGFHIHMEYPLTS